MSTRSSQQAPQQAPQRGFFAALVRRPVMLGMLFLTCILIGLIAYARIPLQLMPGGLYDPGLQVFVANPGASPPENEEQVARVLEEELRTLQGVKDIESGSSQDSVFIWVSFDSSTDMAMAKAEVRDRVERARPRLPDTVQQIGLWSWNETDLPILYFALMHPGDSDRTDFLIDSVIKQRVEAVEGVGRVEVHGVQDDSMLILLDEDRVRAARLDLGALIRRMSSDNFALPLGEVSDGGNRVLLRSDMRFTSAKDIENYPIGGGRTISDIGRVVQSKSLRNSAFRLNSSPSYFGEIQKDGQANVVATCRRVVEVIEELEKDPKLAGQFKFQVVFNQGALIEGSLNQLRTTALQGGGFAVLILLLFLRRIRLTICVALSIPVSLLLAIAWTYSTGGTLNFLIMTGVTLAMGMLVDNAVVVVENITRIVSERAARGEPDTPDAGHSAAVEGVREVGLAVLLSTLTTVVVFLPIIFMIEDPVMRIVFSAVGLPLCVSLLVSLLVALIFIPVGVARIVGTRSPALERVASFVGRWAGLPGRLLGRAVAHGIGARRAGLYIAQTIAFRVVRVVLAVIVPLRWVLAVLVVALAVWKSRGAIRAYEIAAPLKGLGALGADVEPSSLVVNAYFGPALLAAALLLLGVKRWSRRAQLPPPPPAAFVPQGHSVLHFVVEANRTLVTWTLQHRMFASLLALSALASGGIPQSLMTVMPFGEDENTSYVRFYISFEDDYSLSEASSEAGIYEDFLEKKKEAYEYENIGLNYSGDNARATIYWKKRRSPEQREAVIEDLRQTLPKIAGHRVRFLGDEAQGDKSRSIVMWRITGPDSEELARVGQRALNALQEVPGISSINSPLSDAPEQVRVIFQPEVGLQLGVTASGAFQTISWALRGWQLPRFQEEGREIPLVIQYDEEQAAGVDTLKDLDIFTGTSVVPLSSVSVLEYAKGSRTIRRRNGKVSFTIQALVDDPNRQREASDAGFATLQSLDLPRGYEIGEEDLVGRRQEQEFKEVFSAGLLSIFLVWLLMCILFEHLILPWSVLTTIPFAVVGSFWTLYLTGTTMDTVGWIGIIILVGVVVNNGIVLIHRIHTLRAEGMDRHQAVLEGCTNRVRPILMTAMTTVIGLLPMAISAPPTQGIDYRALATCVAGGLAFSTFFTLWVVPLAYTVIDDFALELVRFGRWALRRSNETAELKGPEWEAWKARTSP
jgi:HAE1 family hydrophobic/amphiphilic exporter-1